MNLQILENTTVGKIPPILTMNDGTPVTDRATWEKRRAELTELAVGLQFGGMPPEPEFLEVEPIDEQGWGKTGAYRVTTGRKDAPISFTFYLSLPATPGDYPVIVDGDLWTPYIGRDDILPTVRERGAVYAVFNRVEIAPDNFSDRDVALYAVYPGLKFSGLAAWAWGYARTTDALIKMGLANTNRIVYTGHSRGGKAALLAGVTDPRAVIVNPTGSGCGGMGLYHVHCRALTEEGKESRDERLDDIIKNFGYWFSADLADYVGRDGELPFDQHWLAALVAPRFLLLNEGISDIWANPVGTYLSYKEAAEVYKFLGAENNIHAKWRPGGHSHNLTDWTALLDVMDHVFYGKPLPEGLDDAPEELKAL